MTKPRRVLAAVLPCVALALSGCEGPLGVPPDADPLLRTDAQEYTLTGSRGSSHTVTIPYTFTNRTGRDVHLSNCGGATPPALDRLDADGWHRAWSPVLLMCLSPDIVIPPGGVRLDTLELYAGAFGSNGYPQFDRRDVAGTYRLVWYMAGTTYERNGHSYWTELPLDRRVSNAFRLQEP